MTRIKRPKKEMEYEQAPSGYVTLYNYKEPFMLFEEGYGYQGVLLFDGASDKVQCHMCGEWYEALGPHIGRTHGLLAQEYKKMVGLSCKTALIGEKFREKLIATYTGNDRAKNLMDRTGVKMSQASKDRIRKARTEFRAEEKNRAGTCPAQLIDRLRKDYRKKGIRLQEKKIPYKEALLRTYGSLKNALKIAGLSHFRTTGKTIKAQLKNPFAFKPRQLIRLLRDFVNIHDRHPSPSDFRRGLLPSVDGYKLHWKDWREALQIALKH